MGIVETLIIQLMLHADLAQESAECERQMRERERRIGMRRLHDSRQGKRPLGRRIRDEHRRTKSGVSLRTFARSYMGTRGEFGKDCSAWLDRKRLARQASPQSKARRAERARWRSSRQEQQTEETKPKKGKGKKDEKRK